MADTFGLNGYMCEMTPVKGGFLLSAWHDKFPDVRASKKVASEDLTPGLRPDDRAQVERIFAPVFDELDSQFDKRVEEEAKTQAEAHTKARAAARKHRARGRKIALEQDPTEPVKAKDGSYPGSDTSPVPEDPAQREAEAITTGTTNATSAAAADAKTQAEATKKNEVESATTGSGATAPANSASHSANG